MPLSKTINIYAIYIYIPEVCLQIIVSANTFIWHLAVLPASVFLP